MSKAIIHVNRAHIAANIKDAGNRHVYTIKQGGKTTYARQVHIDGPSVLVYTGDNLSCGARAWIETDAPMRLEDPMTFQQVKETTQ